MELHYTHATVGVAHAWLWPAPVELRVYRAQGGANSNLPLPHIALALAQALNLFYALPVLQTQRFFGSKKWSGRGRCGSYGPAMFFSVNINVRLQGYRMTGFGIV